MDDRPSRRMNRLRAFLRIAAAVLAMASTAASAFPGQLDTTFGSSGVVNTQVSVTAYFGSYGGASGVVRQPDGKVVVAGSTGLFSQPSRFALVRFNPDGTPDGSFGSEGRVNGGPPIARASGLLLDADGRIVVVGTAYESLNGRSRIALARFLADGSPDSSFGTGGVVTTALSGDSASASAARFDTSGRIVVVGQTGSVTGLASAGAVVRYTAGGALDATFGQAGFVTIAYPTFTGGANDVALDAGGRIVVAGTGGTAPVLNRLNADGSLDPSFGGTGQLVIPTIGSGAAVAFDGSGRIVVAGSAFFAGNSSPEMAVFRVTEAGLLDAAFGSAGVVFSGFGPASYGYAVRVDAGGRILVAGSASASTSFARFLDSGALDATFGTGGRVTMSGNSASDMAPGDAGRHYWAGDTGGELTVGSLLDTGAPDPVFNGGSPASPPSTIATGIASQGSWNALALASGGRIVAAGSAVASTGEVILVTRREADGAADATFDGSGMLVARIGGSESRADAVLVDASDRIVVAGSRRNPGPAAFALARFLPDGTRDAAFGANGEVVTAFGTGADMSEARALVVDASGRLIAGGAHVSGGDGGTRFALARYLPDGSLDAAFGTGGKVIAEAGSADAGIRALALDAAGRIVAAGDSNAGGRAVLARFTAEGALDATLGSAGIVPLNGSGALGANGTARAVLVDPAGKIVVGGSNPFVLGFPLPYIKVLRFDEAGAPDPAFENALGLAGRQANARALALDASGRIVAVGDSSGSVLMTRLAATGNPDTSFGIGSVMRTSVGVPMALRLLPDGRALVAGRGGSTGGFFARFAMASPPGMHPLSIVRTGAGAVTSSLAGLDCGSTCIADVAAGTPVTLTATADAGWRFDGWGGDCSGTGPCTVTVDAPRAVTASFVSTQVAQAAGRFANLSTRMKVQQGDNVLIGGFVIGGSAPKTVVVRARGPSLASFGLPDTLPNPQIGLYAAQTVLASNDDWTAGPDAAAIQASGLEPADPREAALRATLAPGGYTVIVSGMASQPGASVTGTGIVEVFNPDPSDGALINIATRGLVLTGNDVMIAGFVIQGDAPQSVVVRARGQSLSAFGIANPLADPLLQVFSGQTEIARNDNWQSGSAASEIQALGLQPLDFRESAVFLTLAPGAYTAIVSGMPTSPRGGGTTGVALVEVFAVTIPAPPP